MKKILVIVGLTFLLHTLLVAQTKTNLDVIYTLIEESVSKFNSNTSNEKISNFSFSSTSSYEFLKSKVINAFIKSGYLLKNDEAIKNRIDYSIQSIKVDYTNPFKDGFFGEVFVERNIILDATAISTNSSNIHTINLSSSLKDTVNIEDIGSIENAEIPFTSAPIPEIPLLSNLLEPIIVVGTLIVTVILFFTIRSK